jgi:uncharacterized hydrophobic protein (TIGR00271 family)
MNYLNNFKLGLEKEDFQLVEDNIQSSIEFKGTNLWILIFAILIASLGLNVNSTAVIIGAMLISPLMGPIIGLGFGMAINDLSLLRKSLYSYLFSAAVGLATSTLFFLISPLNEAHSEILSRTEPTIYDVLIALFGGLAGMLAVSSKRKGNVIPGVAIATALMPPLCTAGYGLATVKFNFFFGAFYLFLINSVFIALAALLTSRYLRFPYKSLPNERDEQKAKRIVWLIVTLTLLPSLYFGYSLVQQDKYLKKATMFIENEAIFPNDFLLSKTIDPKKKTIALTYGGQFIEENEIQILKSKLPKYDLENTTLSLHQGFAYIKDNKPNAEMNQLSLVLNDKEKQIQILQSKIDSVKKQNNQGKQIFKELKTQYPDIQSCILQTAINNTDTNDIAYWIAILQSKSKWSTTDKKKIDDWLKVRLNNTQLQTYYQSYK